MNIIYLGSFRLPNLDAAAPRVLNVAKALRESGHTVSFISWGGIYRESDLCQDGKYRVDGFEYIITNELDATGFIAKVKSKLTRGNKTKALLRQRVTETDAIITYNGKLSSWLLSFTLKHHIKLINDITEWFLYSELKITDCLPYACDMYIIQKKIKNKIVISDYLNRFYTDTHNIVIPATVDLTEMKWHDQKNISIVQRQLGSFDGITLIYAGDPSRKDLLHYAINVVQRLNDEKKHIRFIIVGTTREQYLAQNGDLLHNPDLHKNICFVGRVAQEMIPAYYAISDYMVLLRKPNRKSNAGFPTKFSESIAAGTPVIANITSDLGRYLKDGVTGFVVENPSEEALYDTLTQKVLVTDKAKGEIIRNNVNNLSASLDYHTYIEPLGDFMRELK